MVLNIFHLSAFLLSPAPKNLLEKAVFLKFLSRFLSLFLSLPSFRDLRKVILLYKGKTVLLLFTLMQALAVFFMFEATESCVSCKAQFLLCHGELFH